MARQERSAGFIVFNPPAAGFHSIEFLLLDYGHHWDFPKGHLEKGENDFAAAIRELSEETGLINPRVVPGFHQEIVYFFRHKRHGVVRKTVIFFLAATDSRQIKLSDEHCGFAFLPFEAAVKRLTFPNARQVLRAAFEHLGKLPNPN